MLLVLLACTPVTPGTELGTVSASIAGEAFPEVVDGFWTEVDAENYGAEFAGHPVALFELTGWPDACEEAVDVFGRLTDGLDTVEDDAGFAAMEAAVIAAGPDPAAWIEAWAVGSTDAVAGDYSVVSTVRAAGQMYASARVRTRGGHADETTRFAIYDVGTGTLAGGDDTLDVTVDAAVGEDHLRLDVTLGPCEGFRAAQRAWFEAYDAWVEAHPGDC